MLGGTFSLFATLIVTPEIGNLNSRQERVNIHSMDYLLSTFTIIIFYYYYQGWNGPNLIFKYIID